MSASVWRAYADPVVAHLMIMRNRIVRLNLQPENLRRQRTGRREHGVGGDDPVTLRGDEGDAGIDQILLGVEDVERGALPDAGFLAHAVERDLRRVDLRRRRLDLGLGGFELAPGLGRVRDYLIACGLEVEAPLSERLLGLADGRVFLPSLIERHRQLAGNRRRELLQIAEVGGRAELLV